MCKMSVTELLSKEDLIFCSHLKHPDKKSEGTYIHYDYCHLASLNGSKYTVQQPWQEVVVHPLTSFKILVQVLVFPFNNSSCFISFQLWLLLEAFLMSPLYCLVQLFPGCFFYLVLPLFCALAPSQAFFFSFSYLTTFWQIFSLFQPLSLCLPASTTCSAWQWWRQQ